MNTVLVNNQSKQIHVPLPVMYLYWKIQPTCAHYPLLLVLLEDTARCASLLLAPAEGFGRGRGLFCPSGKKRAYHAVFAHFRQLNGAQ